MSFLTESIYDEALKAINLRMNEANKRKYNLFGKSWYTEHFTWNDVPRIGDEFKTIIGKRGYDIAASTINRNSGDPVRAFDGFGELKQAMFTYAHIYKIEAEDLHDIAIYSKMFSNEPAKVLDYIINVLYNVREKAIKGIHERLDIMILTALTNGGSYTFSSANDPNSPFIGEQISFGTPSIGSVSTEWTAANASTVDPIADIGDVVDAMDVTPTKVLMSKARALYVCQNSKVRQYINGVNNAGNPVTLVQVNSFLSGLGLPTIEIVNKKCRVQNGDSTSEITPFDGNKILFVPGDNFGTIESTFSDKELGLVSPGIDYSNAGRIEVTSWKAGEKEGTNYTEFVKAKVTAAPAIDRIADMYQLTVETAN